jgi:hypothetical protein
MPRWDRGSLAAGIRADRILAATDGRDEAPSGTASSLWLYTTIHHGNRLEFLEPVE